MFKKANFYVCLLGQIFYVVMAKKSLMYNNEIALLASHLVESDTMIK